jgi:hypothetical protein
MGDDYSDFWTCLLPCLAGAGDENEALLCIAACGAANAIPDDFGKEDVEELISGQEQAGAAGEFSLPEDDDDD